MKPIFKPTDLLIRSWVFSCLVIAFTSCSAPTSYPPSKLHPPQAYPKVNKPSNPTYLGLSPTAAAAAATSAGLRCRIIKVDGIHQPVTKDYRPTRLNFTVEHAKVVRITKG